jgi:hypothetical protein
LNFLIGENKTTTIPVGKKIMGVGSSYHKMVGCELEYTILPAHGVLKCLATLNISNFLSMNTLNSNLLLTHVYIKHRFLFLNIGKFYDPCFWPFQLHDLKFRVREDVSPESKEKEQSAMHLPPNRPVSMKLKHLQRAGSSVEPFVTRIGPQSCVELQDRVGANRCYT